ncbi:MAG: Tll0287-like domain-containing protein [Gammaproteobacteria bacterium]
MTKLKALISATFTVAVIAGTPSHAADTEALAAEARGAMKALGGQLKERLQAAMKEGGPGKAITVCNTLALPIGRKVSLSAGMDVGRTSLKLRNPENAPDDWELAQLQNFEALKAKGEPVKKMEHYEIVEANGKKLFRYMKPIPTGRVCTTCHGENLNPTIAEKLDELYPEDKARGFNEGDIRGAFTISKPVYD